MPTYPSPCDAVRGTSTRPTEAEPDGIGHGLCSITATTNQNTGKNHYRKVSNIRRTKPENVNVSRLGLQLSLRNILKPSVGWRMKM